MLQQESDIPAVQDRRPDAGSVVDAAELRGSDRPLTWTLRALGMLDLVALVAVGMPQSWMAAIHTAVGLGTMPDAPVVGYLARSASALYALHGVLVLYISRDVRYYASLIRFFAAAAVVHGIVMVLIDVGEGMPRWWALVEGPSFAAVGVAVLAVQTRCGPSRSRTLDL